MGYRNTGVLGYYNPFTRNVSLCYERLSQNGLAVTLHHELVHAVSVCGWWKMGCKDCMIEESRAYYLAGQCITKEKCLKYAWASCTINSFCAIDDLFGKESKDYDDDTPWPPNNP